MLCVLLVVTKGICAYQVFHWLCVPYLFAGYYSVNTIVMSSVPSNVAAHATATSAPDHPVWLHGSRGENFSSLLGVWHRGKRSVQDIVDQIQIKISSPGGIAEGVRVPTLRTSSALTPSTGQGPQKRAKPQVATNPKYPESPNVPIGGPPSSRSSWRTCDGWGGNRRPHSKSDKRTTIAYYGLVGCSVLGRGAEPLVRTQFLEHPPTLNFGANHLKKWIQHPQNPPIPVLSPHNPHCRGDFWGGQRVRAQLEQS